jgi:HSP90 family molecular chaperone
VPLHVSIRVNPVLSLFAKPCRYIWASGADGQFTVSEDEGENEDLGRGTLIKIHLKEGEEVRVVTFVLCNMLCNSAAVPSQIT